MALREITTNIRGSGYEVRSAIAVSGTESQQIQIALPEPANPSCDCMNSLPPGALVMHHGHWIPATLWNARGLGKCSNPDHFDLLPERQDHVH